jgi:hypothetical protein
MPEYEGTSHRGLSAPKSYSEIQKILSESNPVQEEIMPESKRTVAEIRAELAAALQAETAEKEALAKATQPVYKFTLELVTDNWDKIFDPTCSVYKLIGEVLNKDELKAVGKVPFEGAGRYLFNGATHRFVMAVSGGSYFVSHPDCFAELSDFVVYHTDGGDVTEIVNRYRNQG